MKVYHHEQSAEEKAASKRGKRSRRKGKLGEKWIADYLREQLEDMIGPGWFEVTQRNQGKWSGRYRPEVAIHKWGNYHHHIIHIESKRDETSSPLAALRQAQQDVAPGAVPIAICKRSNETGIVVCELSNDIIIPYLRTSETVYARTGAHLRRSLSSATSKSAGGVALGVLYDLSVCAMWLGDFIQPLRAYLRLWELDSKGENEP